MTRTNVEIDTELWREMRAESVREDNTVDEQLTEVLRDRYERDAVESQTIKPMLRRLNELGVIDVDVDDIDIEWEGVDIARDGGDYSQ